MNSPARRLQKTSADNGSTLQLASENYSALHTRLSRRPASHHHTCVYLSARSLRYLNITPSRGPGPIWAKVSPQPHLHRVHSAYTPTAFAEARPLASCPSSGVACPGESCLPACHPHPVPGALGFQSLFQRLAAGLGEVGLPAGCGEVLSVYPLPELVGKVGS